MYESTALHRFDLLANLFRSEMRLSDQNILAAASSAACKCSPLAATPRYAVLPSQSKWSKPIARDRLRQYTWPMRTRRTISRTFSNQRDCIRRVHVWSSLGPYGAYDIRMAGYRGNRRVPKYNYLSSILRHRTVFFTSIYVDMITW